MKYITLQQGTLTIGFQCYCNVSMNIWIIYILPKMLSLSLDELLNLSRTTSLKLFDYECITLYSVQAEQYKYQISDFVSKTYGLCLATFNAEMYPVQFKIIPHIESGLTIHITMSYNKRI